MLPIWGSIYGKQSQGRTPGIWYDRRNDFTLYTYTDVDWAKDRDDRKSTSGGAFFLGGRLVSCLRKKQDCIS